jgi:hypothetical protein
MRKIRSRALCSVSHARSALQVDESWVVVRYAIPYAQELASAGHDHLAETGISDTWPDLNVIPFAFQRSVNFADSHAAFRRSKQERSSFAFFEIFASEDRDAGGIGWRVELKGDSRLSPESECKAIAGL